MKSDIEHIFTRKVLLTLITNIFKTYDLAYFFKRKKNKNEKMMRVTSNETEIKYFKIVFLCLKEIEQFSAVVSIIFLNYKCNS